MKKQVVVVGLGRLGASLATTLSSLGHDVLALDTDERNVQSIASQVTRAVQGDATNETTLRELGVGNFDIAIVTIGGAIEASVLSTLLLKKVGVRYIIARADNEWHGSILERIGADKVVYPEREMGVGMAHVLTLGDVIDYIPVVPGYGVVKLVAPSAFVGQTLAELGFGPRGKWKVAALMIVRKQDVTITPSDAEPVKPGDALVLSGSWDNLEELFAKFQETKKGA